jgi:hypothetical protein
MIPNITKGSSFAGALRYDLNEEKGYLLDTNCAARDADGIAAEMDVIAASSRCKKPVHHVSLRLAPGESRDDDGWRQIGKSYMQKMGFNEHQYVMTRHTDKEHGDHIHIVTNRADSHGKAWSDSNDQRRAQQACREIEKEFGLQRLEDHEIKSDGRMNDIQKHLRESIAESRGKGLNALRESISRRGYELKLHTQSTGRVQGASIKSLEDGKTWKLSELKPGGLRAVQSELNGAPQLPEKKPKVAKMPSLNGLMGNPLSISNINKLVKNSITKGISKGLEL